MFCKSCPHSDICNPPFCPPVNWINGKAPRREPLASDIIAENINNEKNYNEILSELVGDRREKMEEILNIPDHRKKLILLAILAGYSQKEIAGYFKLSIRQIYNITHK